jgi:hypothetical protein
MKCFTDKYIISLMHKYRDVFIEDMEESLCLDCYNMVKRLNLSENDVELEESVCKLCNEKKPCVK